MTQSSQRSAMVPVTRSVRAYFAPVDRQREAPAIFDPARHGAFDLDNPPSPWLDVGAIHNFDRISTEDNDVLRTGSPSLPTGTYRRAQAARIEFDFCNWGKLQMALACGSQHLNVLASDLNADPDPLGGTAATALAVLPGSTASEIVVGTGAVSSFHQGDVLAIDVDYQQQTGYVGTGISGAYVRDPADVKHDPDYIRRVTFNVGRVAFVTASSLVLGQALIGGAPPPGASVQKIVAFTDRDGGSFFQEWSGLFVFQEDSGGRICLYYPRLIASPAPTKSAEFRRESRIEIAKPIDAIALHASFLALRRTDTVDSESVLCYRTYFPATNAALY